ncbi:MAG TPA: CBS domain-containing protein [Phycisphaerales bacterium]|nr:CBS domain-containing protein [Phycisphaerales bacterium]
MATAATLLAAKRAIGTDHLVAVHRDANCLDAAKLMNERRVGSVVVLDYAGHPVGMFTERDVLTRIVAAQREPGKTFVDDVMSEEPIVCRPETPIDDLRRVIRERRIRHIPVVDDEHVAIGLVSIGDINAHDTRELHETVTHLEEFITRG